MKLNIPNPDTTSVGSQTIVYDANGNRTSFSAYGPTDTYAFNNLNQYTSRNGTNAAYDNNGNLVTGVEGSSYTYDAQNRLTSAYKNGTTETFKYDGLNRQVSRTVNGLTTYNVYDGWDLIEEYQAGGSVTAAYLSGAGGLIENPLRGNFYYQDGSGSTSHLADSTGHLLEWYRYDLQGTPVFYDANNNQRSASAYDIRHLFTGQQWYSELGLYDLRNRFYSPDIGRFLQPDPIGFDGDPTNLYRYCSNNPLKLGDPQGLSATLTIYSSYPSRSSWTGHSWVVYTSDQTRVPIPISNYGNIRPYGVLTGQEGNYWSANTSRSTWLNDGAENQFLQFVVQQQLLGPEAYGLLDTCASFSARAWQAGTGEFLEYLSASGIPLPSTLADSIKAANGGNDYGYKDSPPDDDGSAGNTGELDRLIVTGTPIRSGSFSPGNLGYTGPTSGLGFIGNYFDLTSGGWTPGGRGVSPGGTAILNSLNFGLAMGSVFEALGGGGGAWAGLGFGPREL